MITRMAFIGDAEGLEKNKPKCKMVCYLMPGRSVGTRCYLYVGNGLSHLGSRLTDLLSFSPPLLDITEVFIISSTHCHLNDSASSSAQCVVTKQLSSRHLIYPLTPIFITPYHHKHITEFQQWLSGY